MQKVIGYLIVITIICAPLVYGLHLWNNYEKIQTSATESRRQALVPNVDGESVAEFGYIFEMRREDHIRDGYRNLVWFVVIPSTGQRLSCQYDRGFDNFRDGESVRIIHNKVREDEAETGYIVGLYGKVRDKVAMVGTNDLDVTDLLSE